MVPYSPSMYIHIVNEAIQTYLSILLQVGHCKIYAPKLLHFYWNKAWNWFRTGQGFQITMLFKRECIPVGCVPPQQKPSGGSPPGSPSPRSRHPPPGPGTTPLDQAPPQDQAPPWDQAPPYGQTHACKHITLPQTSFAGGNKT